MTARAHYGRQSPLPAQTPTAVSPLVATPESAPCYRVRGSRRPMGACTISALEAISKRKPPPKSLFRKNMVEIAHLLLRKLILPHKEREPPRVAAGAVLEIGRSYWRFSPCQELYS